MSSTLQWSFFFQIFTYQVLCAIIIQIHVSQKYVYTTIGGKHMGKKIGLEAIQHLSRKEAAKFFDCQERSQRVVLAKEDMNDGRLHAIMVIAPSSTGRTTYPVQRFLNRDSGKGTSFFIRVLNNIRRLSMTVAISLVWIRFRLKTENSPGS